ncbi:MAG: hypothetical protein RMJ56_11455 [Gemmataceae bacterium]|nr:hypothetical protein [Gemmata sp.]MDW8198207.1 hypothetical protein [Gemmataceae bacterium]
MKTRFFSLFLVASLSTPPVTAAPRDEALQLAPPDFALVAVLQNFRDHSTAILTSPFAEWFPSTALGQQWLTTGPLATLRDQLFPILASLEVTPQQFFHDIIGDAVVFAYNPAPPEKPDGERSVILLRPRKPELLTQLMGQLNDAQTQAKEIQGVVERRHGTHSYFERQRPQRPSDFYAFRDGVFIFTQSESDLKAALDRANRASRDQPPELVRRLTQLGVADAAAILLLQPRALDRELAAVLKNAKPEEQPLLTQFAQLWSAAESVAVYLTTDHGVELGLAAHFHQEKLPPAAAKWLVGERTPSTLWRAIPDNALFACAGHLPARDLFDFLGQLPTHNGPPLQKTLEQTFGPIIGKDKLPQVLQALGPDAGLWALPPAPEAKFPVLVGAVRISAEGEKAAVVHKALLQSLEYGFQTARITYNAQHTDQLELHEETVDGVTITSLRGTGLPIGVQPCFAIKDRYLLVATSPAAISAFTPPPADTKPGGAVLLARIHGPNLRRYLKDHRLDFVKFFTWADLIPPDAAPALGEQLATLGQALELAERVEVFVHGQPRGFKLFMRVKTTQPLRK